MSYQSRSAIGTVCCRRMAPLYQPLPCRKTKHSRCRVKMTSFKLDSLTTRIFIEVLCVKLVKSGKFVKLVKLDNRGPGSFAGVGQRIRGTTLKREARR